MIDNPRLTQLPLPMHKVILSDPKHIIITTTPPYSDDYFAGHFPDFPILPGVTLLTWTFEFAAANRLQCDPGKISKLKFTNIINADTPLELVLSVDDSAKKVNFLWRNGEQNYASGVLTLSRLAND